MDSLSVQVYAFAVTILAGASAGVMFDVYRLLRGFLRPATGSTAVMDLFFWFVLAPLLTMYLLLANWGELRFYVLIGVVLGLAFYYLVFSCLFIGLLLWLLDILGKVVSGVCQIIITVVAWPISLIQDIGLGFRARRRGRRGRIKFLPVLRWKGLMLPGFRRR